MFTAKSPSFPQALSAVAGFGLTDAALDVSPWSEPEWSGFLGVLRRERLFGFALAAMMAERLRVTPDQRAQLVAHHRQWMLVTLQIEAELLEVTERLAAEGVVTRVLKGPASAHLDYDDPALRCFSDIDLLVRSDQLTQAVRILGGLSLFRDLPQRAEGFDRRFTKEITLAGGGRIEVDLHRTLVLGPFGFTIDLDQLWDGEAPLQLGGETLSALDRPRRFIHAALASVCSDPEPALRTLRDLAQIGMGTSLDTDTVISLTRAWRAEAVLATAIRLCESTLHVSFPPAISALGGSAGDRWQRRALRAYGTSGGTNTTTLLGGTLGLPWRARPAYLRMLIAPSRTYSEARRRASRPPEWRTGLSELVRRTESGVKGGSG